MIDTIEFLNQIAASEDALHCFQVFDDTEEKDKSKAKVIMGRFSCKQTQLQALNKDKRGIFVTVNKVEGKKRRKENVIELRAIFADFDNVEMPEFTLEPSMIIQSKNGAHVYWLLKAGQDLEKFTSIQKMISEKFGSDPTVKDLPRVMRIPGFNHWKNENDPFCVKLLSSNSNRYTLEEIMKGLGLNESPNKNITPSSSTSSKVEHNFEQFKAWVSTKPISQNRNDNLMVILREGLGRGFSENQLFDVMIDYCSHSGLEIEEAETVLKNQIRYHRERPFKANPPPRRHKSKAPNKDVKYPYELAPKPVQTLLDTVSTYTDAPKSFVATAGIATLGMLAGYGRTVLNGIGLNNYYAIVGRTGTTRKTTAQKLASRIVSDISDKIADEFTKYQAIEFGEHHPSPYINLTNFSVEGLEEALKGRGISVLITPGEYKQVFETAKRTAQGNTIPQLTSMWDGTPIKSQTRSHKLEARDYSMNILGVSTESWLKDFFSAENLHGGFLNRHSVISANPPDNPLIFAETINDEKWEQVIKQFLTIVPNRTARIIDDVPVWKEEKINMPFKDHAARKYWELYCIALHKKSINAPEEVAASLARESIHAIKLAGIKAAAENRASLSEEDLFFGHRWAEASSESLIQYSDSKQVNSVEAKLLDYTRQRSAATGSAVSKTEIGKHFGGPSEPFKLAASALIEKGLLVQVGKKLLPASDFSNSECEKDEES